MPYYPALTQRSVPLPGRLDGEPSRSVSLPIEKDDAEVVWDRQGAAIASDKPRYGTLGRGFVRPGLWKCAGSSLYAPVCPVSWYKRLLYAHAIWLRALGTRCPALMQRAVGQRRAATENRHPESERWGDQERERGSVRRTPGYRSGVWLGAC
eukprot:3370079-Rhodomonas_salina.4